MGFNSGFKGLIIFTKCVYFVTLEVSLLLAMQDSLYESSIPQFTALHEVSVSSINNSPGTTWAWKVAELKIPE